MPLIERSDYSPIVIFTNPHFCTIYPHFFRLVNGVNYSRERLTCPDGDFIDLDFSLVGSQKLLIIANGLEASNQDSYVKGMVKAFNRQNWDVVIINYRGCSGEMNRLPKSYHSGATEDLQLVVDYIVQNKKYSQLGLLGFSLGGNLLLKYLGERGSSLHSSIKAAVAISVPCCLKGSSIQLSRLSNQIYMKRFIRLLKHKMKQKAEMFPGKINYADFASVKTFFDFDNLYTAPYHGFCDAEDYWKRCSSKNFVSLIKLPTLLINSIDDPFLNEDCFPFEAAKLNKNFYFETSAYGGHVGFVTFSQNKEYWHESRALSFFQQIIPTSETN